MAKEQTIFVIVALIAIVLVGALLQEKYNIFAITGYEQLTRTMPAIIAPNQQFTVTYSTSGVPNGNWFVAWEEIVTGGCTPTSYKDFTSGTDATNQQKTKTFIAPSSGTCTFSGFYQFTGMSQTNFQMTTIKICQRNTDADVNCDEKVDFNELTAYANKWVQGQVTFQQLIQAANAWVGS